MASMEHKPCQLTAPEHVWLLLDTASETPYTPEAFCGIEYEGDCVEGLGNVGYVRKDIAEQRIEKLIAALEEAMSWNWLEGTLPPQEVIKKCQDALSDAGFMSTSDR